VDNDETVISSHFYAPFKRIGGSLLDTFWSNIIIIWIMTMMLAFTLYFNLFARIFKTIGKASGIIGSTKPKKYV
jgi:hypothetical protein